MLYQKAQKAFFGKNRSTDSSFLTGQKSGQQTVSQCGSQVGAELGIRIFKNIVDDDDAHSLYFLREEKDFFYNPLFLNIRMGYYPAIFKKSMGILGSSFYWTIGLEWYITKNQATYVYRRRQK